MAKKRTEALIQKQPYNDAGDDEFYEGNPNMGPHARFDGLYEDAKKRQERQAKLAEAILDNNCTFKPDTSATKSKNEVLIQKNNVNLGGEARQGQLLDMKLSKYRNNVYHARNQSETNAKPSSIMLFDPNTGQAYFKPRVGRPPKT